MAVADALVSKVLDILISPIGKEIEQEFRLVVGVKKQVHMLTINLQSIHAVLIDVDRRRWKEASVQLWVDRLKDVLYDIDDVLDEWSFAILKLQRERDDSASKPIKLSERLDVIAREKDKYGFLPSEGRNEQVERPITTAVIDISEVKGRKVDIEKLIKMLLAEDSARPKIHPISIVGMGGIGKTTLAKLVYNDERVIAHFEKRIWVCVSDPFDVIRIAKQILESLQGAASNLDFFPNIMEKIQESINQKMILVVLDDVWNRDPRKWKNLEDCLIGSSPGSVVLVTTRNENVGRIMGSSESDIFRVGLLSDEESWELFCMIAFSWRSNEERASLDEIGREVVRRCRGLPLAIRAIAGLLQFKKRSMEWKGVLDSELWDLEEIQRDIVTPLWLSYYDLPSHLKQCFSYCAIFPKDCEMDKGELIGHWMAQGYIQGTQSKDMEIIGDECFESLVIRSLFHEVVVYTDFYGFIKTRFKMHDIVHDLAQLLVKNECLRIEVNDDSEAISLDDSARNLLRHLSISFKYGVRCLDSFYNVKNLRSVIISSSTVLDFKKIFKKFTSLRSLILRNCGVVEVPSNINRLIHLRELDIRGSNLTKLPNTMWELYYLQILNLSGNYRIESVKGIERLTNLRNFENLGTNFLLPIEMVRLSGLRKLKRLNIDVDNVEAFSLKHLENFKNLGESLEIRWLKRGDADVEVEDAKQACLQDKKYITQLDLYFRSKKPEQRENQDEKLVEALNVPPNLELLRIKKYKGLRTPNWLNSLIFVKTVELHYCVKCVHLPSLGKLPCLEKLRLWSFVRVRKVGAEFLGMYEMSSSSKTVSLFPKLTSLEFACFNDWEEWNNVDGGDDEMSIMPSLTYLKVMICPKLKALPNFILKKTSLKLDIIYCPALGKVQGFCMKNIRDKPHSDATVSWVKDEQ